MPELIKTKSYKYFKTKSPIFKLLNESELELITKKIFEVHYKQGEIIFKQGTELSHIIFLNSGLAKIYLEGLNEKNMILQYVKPGELVGGPGAFVDNKHYISLSALFDLSVSFIDINIFKQLMRQNNDFAMEYINLISKKRIYQYNRITSLTQKQMHGRIADALLYMHNEIYNDNKEGFPISRQNLAELTAMSKDSAIRIIKEFKEGGIIEKTDKEMIKIINMKLLIQISEFG